MAKTRLTQQDVARHAGVSQAIVSRILNNKNIASIPQATRDRVLLAIEELGYVRDGVARGMRTGRSMLIGSVIPDITNPFYPAFQRGVQDVAEAAGYSLVTFNTDGLRARELASVNTAIQCGVDGLIVSLFQASAGDLQVVDRSGLPLVVYGTLTDQPAELVYDVLDVDIVQATRDSIQFLRDRGHRMIGLIDGPEDITRTNLRLPCYEAMLAELGLERRAEWVVHTEFSEQGGYHAMQRLTAASPLPTSLLAANDLVAMGILSWAEEAGVSIPDQLAVVGYDDIPAARLLRPALTTVALHPERIGRRAAEMLLDRLGAEYDVGRGRQETLSHDLIVRSSA